MLPGETTDSRDDPVRDEGRSAGEETVEYGAAGGSSSDDPAKGEAQEKGARNGEPLRDEGRQGHDGENEDGDEKELGERAVKEGPEPTDAV